MGIYKKFRKTVSKARKGIRKVARAYLKAKRTPLGKMVAKRVRNYGFSSTAVAKSLSTLRRKAAVSSELKTLDQFHVTGSPDVTLRQFFRIQASANEATQSTTTTLGTVGYLLRQVNFPSKGTGTDQYDGQKFCVESIQWKGTLNLANNASGADTTVKLMIVKFRDNHDGAFTMSEFLNTDHNGEYSIKSRRNRDYFEDYQIVAQRTYKLSYGNRTRQDFNIFSKPKSIIRHLDTGSSTIKNRFYCIALVSGDIADKVSHVDYSGNTRMRFVH